MFLVATVEASRSPAGEIQRLIYSVSNRYVVSLIAFLIVLGIRQQQMQRLGALQDPPVALEAVLQHSGVWLERPSRQQQLQ